MGVQVGFPKVRLMGSSGIARKRENAARTRGSAAVSRQASEITHPQPKPNDDVSYEPSANTVLGRAYAGAAGEVRQLRAAIAAASSLGVFRLDDERDADDLLQRMRSMKALDPGLAVYAAYAFHERRRRAEIADMAGHLERQLLVRIFDVAMLSFSMSARGVKAGDALPLYPCVPMLTQGWALLSPLGITLPGRLDTLRGLLRASLWTHFEPAAAELLLGTINEGGVG